MDNAGDLELLSYRRRNLRRIFTVGMDYTDLWGREMDLEFIDRVARETVVPDWWSPAWDMGLLWSSWAPPRVLNTAAHRLAALLPPGIRNLTAQTTLPEFAARTQESPTAVLQDWLFPEGVRIAAADAPLPFTWVVWHRMILSPKAHFLLPSLDLAEEAGQWLLHAARNDARRNLLEWAPEGPHGRRRSEDDQLWTQVRARTRQKAPSLSLGTDPALLPSADIPHETLVEIQDLLQVLKTMATPQECNILELLLSGSSPEDIANRLGISRSTVHVHCFNLRQKCAQL